MSASTTGSILSKSTGAGKGAVSGRLNYRAVSQIHLCEIMGWTPATINRWISWGAPVDIDASGAKTYDPRKICDWLVSKKLAEGDEEPDAESTSSGSSPALERWRQAKAQRAELELSVLKKTHHHDDEVSAWFLEAAEYVRCGIQGMGRKLAEKLVKTKDADETERMISEELDGILERLASGMEKH